MPSLIQLVEIQHQNILSDYRSEPDPECNVNFVRDMEDYYRRPSQRNRYRSAISSATWVPKHVRVHMIKHLDLLQGKRRAITRSRRRGLVYILKHPDVERVSIKPRRISQPPLIWTRDKNGIHLRSPTTGRFQHQSNRERALQRRLQGKHK